MDERLIRWLLATILAIFLLILSLPSSPAGGADSPVLEKVALFVAGMIADAVDTSSDAVGGLAQRMRTRSQLERENQRLSHRLEELQEQNLRLLTANGRLHALEQSAGFRRSSDSELVAAEIVYRNDRSSSPAWIVRTPPGGWEIGQPVLTVNGVVGRVTGGSGDYARVQPLTDLDHAMGAMIERTRRQGIARGSGGSRLTLEYIPRRSDVRLGDRVVTAGIDGIFPRGLEIGEVVSVQETDDLLLQIDVRSSVDFSILEVVHLFSGKRVAEEVLADSESQP